VFCGAGKVFIYWLGTEPFLYVADPEFLKKMSGEVMARSWGKPTVFKNDRDAMFGKGLVMTEGDDWVRHRHVITPAFHPTNLKVPPLSLSIDLSCINMDGELVGKYRKGKEYNNFEYN
jgi:hypothetical protein